MKLIIRDYLASLKEREELDAILPDLLSELGFNVYSRPRRGTVQHGVDIAAVGEDEDGEKKVFLFSVKKGNLTRQDWDGSPQALRPSLDEIKDAYIRSRIPARYKHLKIVICIVFGGEVQEEVRPSLTGYIANNITEQITYDEWNGDRLAGLILKGILQEEILPEKVRSYFRKAVAMVDEPEVSYEYFNMLVKDLCVAGDVSAKARTRAARQIHICLWILFVWARDIDNVESPYRASEISLMAVWGLVKSTSGKKTKEAKSLQSVFGHLINLHLDIVSEFLEHKVLPYARVRNGISMSISYGSRSALDINLALFETLGRISLAGLWFHWFSVQGEIDKQDEMASSMREKVVEYTRAGMDLIRNNPILWLPFADRQGTDISLFLQLCFVSKLGTAGVASWLREMAHRLDFTMRTGGRYPSASPDYRDLCDHPRDESDDYFKEATAGSTLIPIIAAWSHALGEDAVVEKLSKLTQEKLEHCNLQLWMPDKSSEDELFLGGKFHGRAICDLSLDKGGDQLLATIKEASQTDNVFQELTPIKSNVWPILLVACRHHQLPIPPDFWIDSLMPPDQPEDG